MRRCLRSLLALACVCFLLGALPGYLYGDARGEPEDVALAGEIAAFRRILKDKPRDVDTRFALAQRLSRAGNAGAAEREARRVVADAPNYWDARILIARLAAWSQRYELAREQLSVVLDYQPDNVEALSLAVDVELWDGERGAAKARLATLSAIDDSAATRYRRAMIANSAMRPLEARRWARRTLEADRGHSGAKSLLRNVKRIRFTSVTELELFPIDDNELAIGENLSATLFPAARWSASLAYDYRLRFGTENHRGRLAVAHRLSDELTVDGLVRAGSTEVVPEFSGQLGLSARFLRFYGASVRYLGDKMPWPGQLHRLALAAGAGLPSGFELAATYEVGLLRYCDETDPVQSVTLSSALSRGVLRASLRYGFGMELDRAPLPPFLAERFGDDVCSANDIDDIDDIDISLRDTRAQLVGASVGIADNGRYAAHIGYTAIYRLTGELVHLSFVSLNIWL